MNDIPGAPSTPAPFPHETAWSTVLGARNRDAPDWQARLESLVRRYWKPVHGFLVRRWKCSPEDAMDLTQEFFLQLYERDGLQEASPSRGRFRTFIKLKLHSLVVDELRRRAARKRGGGARVLRLDDADGTRIEPPAGGLSPEDAFDRIWADCTIRACLKELEQRYAEGTRRAMYRAFWLCTIEDPPKPFRECAQALGIKETDVGNYVVRLRREFRDLLRAQVRDCVEREGDVDEELHHLLRLLREPASG